MRWLLTVLAAAIAAGAVQAQETPARPIKIHVVEAASDERMLVFPAVVRAARSTELAFERPGRVVELDLREGETVEEGDVVARLDDEELRFAVEEAQARFANADAEYQRARRLLDQNAIARSTVEQRETDRDVARAALSSAQKDLAETVIRAPFSGAISNAPIERFQSVQAGQMIAALQSDALEAVIDAPASLVAIVPQMVDLDVTVTLDAARDRPVQAEFQEGAGVADSATQTFEAAFAFERPDNLLVLPGMTGTLRARFSLDADRPDATPGFAAPLAAVVSEAGETFVWVVDRETMTLARRDVVVGDAMIGEVVEIVEGLASGEAIVAAGAGFAFEGMRVREWKGE